MSKIEIFNEEDRLTVAKVLVKNGYTVRQLRERVEGKRSYIYLLEYTKPKKSKSEGGVSNGKGDAEAAGPELYAD